MLHSSAEPPIRPSRFRLAGVSTPLWAATAADVVGELDPGEVAARLGAAVAEVWRRV